MKRAIYKENNMIFKMFSTAWLGIAVVFALIGVDTSGVGMAIICSSIFIAADLIVSELRRK
jgi:hypothetical protein